MNLSDFNVQSQNFSSSDSSDDEFSKPTTKIDVKTESLKITSLDHDVNDANTEYKDVSILKRKFLNVLPH